MPSLPLGPPAPLYLLLFYLLFILPTVVVMRLPTSVALSLLRPYFLDTPMGPPAPPFFLRPDHPGRLPTIDQPSYLLATDKLGRLPPLQAMIDRALTPPPPFHRHHLRPPAPFTCTRVGRLPLPLTLCSQGATYLLTQPGHPVPLNCRP